MLRLQCWIIPFYFFQFEYTFGNRNEKNIFNTWEVNLKKTIFNIHMSHMYICMYLFIYLICGIAHI